MPKIPEDIILIIFRYIHSNKIKLLNQQYTSCFKYNETYNCLEYKIRGPTGGYLINNRMLRKKMMIKKYFEHIHNMGKLDNYDEVPQNLFLELPKNY